jgi:hypothetical protein
VDNPGVHKPLGTLEIYAELGMHMAFLPTNSTLVLQPYDDDIFAMFKKCFTREFLLYFVRDAPRSEMQVNTCTSCLEMRGTQKCFCYTRVISEYGHFSVWSGIDQKTRWPLKANSIENYEKHARGLR